MKIYDNELKKVREATEEEIKQFNENNVVSVQSKINELKEELATYYYIGNEIAMGIATREDYAEEIAYTETLRAKIRELENQLI